jgi:hypothetical protein
MRARDLCIVIVLVVASLPARGQPRHAPATEKAARVHLAAADRAFKKGEYDDALAQLQAAYAIDPRPEFLVVFAQVYRAMGDAQRAINACELYLSTAPQGPRANEARGLATAARAELDKRAAAAPPSAPPETSAPPERPSTPLAPPPNAPPSAPPPTAAPPVEDHAPPAPAPRRRRRVAVAIGVSAAVVTVAGVALGLGLGLGLTHGPQTISFDPGH